MKKLLKEIRTELKDNATNKDRQSAHRFYIEPIKNYGTKTPIVRKIANTYWAEIKKQSKKEIFSLCEELLKSDYNEESTIAFQWADKLEKDLVKSDFEIFESWARKYVNNWSKCDDFCTHIFGKLILKHPDLLPKTKKWTRSKNLWMRRISAVILIYPIRKEERFLPQIFWVSDQLLTDAEDMVQKGYGWTLKEAANHYEKEVFEFVMNKKSEMPRTALRYAIEKMPPKLKKEAMGK
ncbi:DNA alkylation repair protein [Patescibacteria group bacterium]